MTRSARDSPPSRRCGSHCAPPCGPHSSGSRESVRTVRPTLPGGYFDMPRCLLDAILAAPGLSGAQLKVVLAVMRLTWGYFRRRTAPGRRSGAVPRRDRWAQQAHCRQVTPLLVSEGIVEQVEPATRRRPAVLRLNPEPSQSGSIHACRYAERRTLAVECHDQGTQGDEPFPEATGGYPGCADRSTQGAPSIALHSLA